jgi:hypothetical protein
MASGPGKYGDLCAHVREKAEARAAIVIIIGGNKGNGFSCQTDAETSLDLPEILERMAAQLRRDTR